MVKSGGGDGGGGGVVGGDSGGDGVHVVDGQRYFLGWLN